VHSNEVNSDNRETVFDGRGERALVQNDGEIDENTTLRKKLSNKE
jgi:hypothetical protein